MLSVAIIGPGAVGTTIAYELQQSLPHTTLIGRHAKTITYYTVPHAPAQDIVVKGYEDVTNTFDVIIIAVKTHQLDAVIPHLTHLAHDIVLEANIQQAIWYKLLVNLGINSITALGRQTVAIMHNPEIRTLCRQLLLDGCRVAQAEGLNFSEQTVDTIMTIYQGYPDEMGTSMYYDIAHQQPLEVEAIQGFIYRRAREHNLDTPYLDTIYSFLRAYQQNM